MRVFKGQITIVVPDEAGDEDIKLLIADIGETAALSETPMVVSVETESLETVPSPVPEPAYFSRPYTLEDPGEDWWEGTQPWLKAVTKLLKEGGLK